MQLKIDTWKKFITDSGFQEFLKEILLCDDEYFFTNINTILDSLNVAFTIGTEKDYNNFKPILKLYNFNTYKLEISKKVLLEAILKNLLPFFFF